MKNKTKPINNLIPTLQEFEDTVQTQARKKYRNYDDLIHACNRAMAEKLWENKHKSGFDTIDIQYAKRRIHEELIELEEAETTADIRREAADIANFAAMIILKCDKGSDACQ